jgi:hypothetical protein
VKNAECFLWEVLCCGKRNLLGRSPVHWGNVYGVSSTRTYNWGAVISSTGAIFCLLFSLFFLFSVLHPLYIYALTKIQAVGNFSTRPKASDEKALLSRNDCNAREAQKLLGSCKNKEKYQCFREMITPKRARRQEITMTQVQILFPWPRLWPKCLAP